MIMDSNLPCLIVFILIGFVKCSPDNHQHNGTHYDYCVLGAGPSGLQMGYFLSRAKRDYIILERNSGPGSFFIKHRKLISINKIYTGRHNREFNMRHDWNSLLSDKRDLLLRRLSREFFPSADTFPEYLSMYEKELGLRVQYGVDIGRIRAVESAMGRNYILTDQHASHYKCRAVNNDILDTYQLKSLDGLAEIPLNKIAIAQQKEQGSRRMGAKSKEKKGQLYLTLNKYIQPQEEKNSSDVTGEELTGYHKDNFFMRKPYDRVIGCLGFRFNFSVFDSSACPMNSDNAKGRLPAVSAVYEGKNNPGLFVLGTAAHSRDYRSSAGGFIHGFRYTVRAVHRVLEQRYHSNQWQSTTLLTTQLQSWILKRIGEASGTFQMFEVLGDVILLRGSHCEYVEEFTLQALPQFSSVSGHEVSNQGLIVLVMQYGKQKIDYLGRNRAGTVWTKAYKSSFLHPVLYYYDKLPTEEEMKLRPHGWPLPRPKAIHQMVEDFLAEWEAPISHIQPLRHFLENCVQTDLRAHYAETCFRSSLTHRNPPLFCQQGYLKQQGVAHDSQLWQHVHNAGMMPTEQDADTSGAKPALPNYLAQAGASMSSGLKLDF